MPEEKTTYQIWDFFGNYPPEFESDDPVEIANWLRARPVNDRRFNVHPVGVGFHGAKRISHDFISLHQEAIAEDIVRKAFERGEPEGVAKEILDLVHGR